MAKTRTEQRTELLVYSIIVIVFLGVIFGFNGDRVVSWIIPLGISFILSGVAGDLLENLTGDFFKKVYLSIKVWKIRFNLPLFVTLTIIIKLWLFS